MESPKLTGPPHPTVKMIKTTGGTQASYLRVEGKRKQRSELESVCRAEYPRLVGILTLYCGDPDLAEDLAQETVARLCARWTQIRDPQATAAWLRRVAINLANSHFRRKSSERRAIRNLRRDEAMPDSSDAVAIRLAVSNLPPRQRAAIVLRYFAEMTVPEVAALLDCPEGTVKSLTYNAMRSLRKLDILEMGSDERGAKNAIRHS